MSQAGFIVPDWPAPERVRALSTLRHGGVSEGSYKGLNLGAHVGDDAQAVAANRALLAQPPGPAAQPRWLEQVHGHVAIAADDWLPGIRADACVAMQPDQVCAVLTADCLPVLFCDEAGQCVAAAHAGWRGLLSGVLENTLMLMSAPSSRLLAWLGPAIGPMAFEVGDEVRAAFVGQTPDAEKFFAPNPAGRWQADLAGLARQRLNRLGLERIYGGGFCTASDPERFYSYRRDGQCGRMASMVWLDE
ncbi:MAG: peptidoglycan editing factor PgeF [Gammaproteobacteria bacterium]|nr:peptidoglycan editing factor PgeF [Gammaproteobacteria bacterium]